MTRQQLPQVMAERRCPNCGTRVARDAEVCFMCDHDLRIRPARRQRISWVDTLLVLAVIGLLVFWWRLLATDSAPQEFVEQDDQFAVADIPELIPTDTPEPTATPTPRPTATALPPVQVETTHIVQAGETLVGIAAQYGLTVQQIQDRNNLSSVVIRPGDPIKVPVLRVPTPLPNSSIAGSTMEYTVRQGDTIVSIATQFGSRVDAILSTNGLDTNAIIRPDDILRIPVENVPDSVLESNIIVEPSTGGPIKVYAAPQLIGPTNGVTLSRDEPILLRWASVDLLDEREFYVLRVIPNAGSTREIQPIWTKANSHRLDNEFAPAAGESAEYSWRVSVVRVNLQPDGQRTLEAASPTSDVRILTWQ